MATSKPRLEASAVTAQLLPYMCGIVGCEEPAVCALQNKYYTEVRPNVCAAHFERMMGHSFTSLAEEAAKSL